MFYRYMSYRPAGEEAQSDGVADSTHITTERNVVLILKLTGCTFPVVRTSRITVAVYHLSLIHI